MKSRTEGREERGDGEGRGQERESQSPRRVPSEGSGKEGVSPPSSPRAVPNQVRGTLLQEVADHRTPLLHQLSGVVDMARVEPFDDVKMAVKRGEVDWLNIVLSTGWFGHAGTRLTGVIGGSVHILASGGEVESLMQLEGARRVSSPLGHVITNAPFWSGNSEILREVVVDQFVRALNDLTGDPSRADVSISADNYVGRGVLLSQRSAREQENEQAVGGLRNAARAVDRVPGWKLVGHKLSEIIEEVVSEFEDELDKVLCGLGQKEQVEHGCFGLEESDLSPGPGGLFPGSFKVPVGITAPIEPGGVLPIVSPQSVGKEKDRARCLHAKVWGSTKYASCNELEDVADELLQKEVRNGYVHWCANCAKLEQEVGTLHLAKIAVVVKGTKVRLIHDSQRNGTNARVTFREIPRVKDLISGITELFQSQAPGDGVELLTLDFRDAFQQLLVVPSERSFLAGAAMDGFFSYCIVLFGVGSGPLVWCRVAASVMRSTEAWLGAGRAQTKCFVDDPIIALRGTPSQRRRLAMGVLIW